MTGPTLEEWLAQRAGIAHRTEALDAGFTAARVGRAVVDGRVERARSWIALPEGHPTPADPELVSAALARGAVTCVSLARRRGWWMPEDAVRAGELHLHKRPGSGAVPAEVPDRVLHWTRPIAPASVCALEATVIDALAHIAVCQPRSVALVVWESAARVEGLAVDALQAVRWASIAARDLATAVVGLSDSGLETLLAVPLRGWGLRVQQQAYVAGRLVDFLIGERLVVQVDGFAFHASSGQRSSDIALDAELRLRGYTVLRFSYQQVVYERGSVHATIQLAVAQGLHLATRG